MSAPIKRPPRTYGRPKDAVSDDTNHPLQPSESTRAVGSTTYGVATSHIAQNQRERPLPSRQLPLSDVADDQGSDGEAEDASGGFQFDWRAKMREIDEDMAADEDLTVPAAQDASPDPPHPSEAHSRNSDITSNSPTLQRSQTMGNDVFGGNLSTLNASSELHSRSPPASPIPVLNRRRKQHARINSSDEDSEDDTNASGRRSRVGPHPITSPKSRPSSTPPTSDDEIPSRIASDPRTKGKGKASTSRTQVPALRFSDEPVTSHRKRLSESIPAHTKPKLKAPTKKEKLETIRDRGRIAGAHKAAVHPTEASGRYTLQYFFQGVQTASLGRTESLDDPISSFSSSPGQRVASTSAEVTDTVPTPLPPTTILPSAELRVLDESDDENLPEVNDLLSEVTKEKTKAEKLRELQAMKLRLAAQSQPAATSDAEDDDLEIEDASGARETKPKAERVSGGKQNTSQGRKRQLALGGITLEQQRAKQRETPPRPLGLATVRRTQDQLTKDLAMLVAQNNAEMTKNKEDEWVKRGGRVVEVGGNADDTDALRNAALKDYAEKGKKNAEVREARMHVEEEDDTSDEDWSETRGSASPRPQRGGDADEEDADITMVNEEDEDGDDDQENEAPSQFKIRGPRRTLAIIDSDSENENDENAAPVRTSASFILRESIRGQEDDENVSPIELTGAALHRGSASSMDERTEDEGDKENNTRLMYDKSEDKENKAVPRHPFGARPTLGRQGSLFGLEEGMQRSLSMSPGEHEPMTDGGDDENDTGGDKRRPLQNLLADEDPFLAEPPSTSVDFATRLQQASPLPLDTPESTLRPSFDVSRVGGKSVGFSHFSDDSSAFEGAPLQPGFSDLFDAATEQQQAPKRPLSLSASFSDKSDAGLIGLRQTTVSLGLTQDVDLQPAFEVGDHLKRQADAIFEKEQEYLWNAANRKADTKKQQLYVNDHGFLTQTRPDVEKPEIYTPSSPPESGSFFGTQRGALLDPQSLLRRPLRTLSLTESELDAPERSPLQRLAKRTRTPSPPTKSNRSSPSPSPAMKTKNALDLLRRETLGIHAPRPKKPLDKSEYVLDEALESDDDEVLGFGHKGDDGEDEEGEDQDRTLETLVDDDEMDDEKVAAARVMEKYQEQTHEDDLELEKLHQAAVQGELRKKRRNRGLLDDSDDEDEEDEMRARKMRRGLGEPKINRDDVNELAKDPHTKAFYEVYHNDLERGEEAEFAYLQESQLETGGDVDMADEDEDAVLTRTELTERLRELARQEQGDQPEMDVEDVSWVDREDSDGEDQTKVKAVSLRRSVGGVDARNRVRSPERKRMNSWAKMEGRTRNGGTGRASGRTAVTGQMSKARAGGGTLRTSIQSQSQSQPQTNVEATRRLKVQASFLSGVSDRSARFA